ncbi:MAG TPA: amidohydrolase family protein [Vicinamibacterales bacterium]|nr:amidohydrolase family protein [Vicinamibacterales bacterium]
MRWSRIAGSFALACGLALAAVHVPAGAQAQATGVTLFENARLIVGDGSTPIERSAFVVRGNRIVSLGRAGEIQPPAGAVRVDLTGKTVMPAIVDTHSHLGYFDEVANKELSDEFTKERVIDHLNRFAYTGHALTYSYGSDSPELIDARYSDDPTHFVDLRAESEQDSFTGARYFTVGRGLAWPGTGNPRSTTFYPVVSPWLAKMAVRELASQKVKLVKLWVEDRWGFKDPQSKEPSYFRPDAYKVAIDEAHRLNLRTVAHTKSVKDWKGLIRAGVDATTHTVEDAPVDEELLALIKARPGFPNISALTSELQGGSAPRAPGQRPEWLKDPLLTTLKCPAFIEEWGRNFEKRAPAPRDGGLWAQNTVQIRKAGATIIMGSHDAGGQRVLGWGSHMEMEAFVNWVGMTPSQAIAAATSVSAKFVGVDDRLGTLAVGKGADFIVLDANPLDDIRNTRKIAQVYLRGRQVDRAAMKTKWDAQCRAAASTQ